MLQRFIVSICLLILLFYLQYALWFGSNGYYNNQHIREKIVAQQQAIEKKTNRNRSLYAEIVSLRHDDRVLEALARENLGMIKSDETFYQVIDQTHDKE